MNPKNAHVLTAYWTAPANINGVNFYFATTNSGQKCEVNNTRTECDIGNLSPFSIYEVSLEACNLESGVVDRICSLPSVLSGKTRPSSKSNFFTRLLPRVKLYVPKAFDISSSWQLNYLLYVNHETAYVNAPRESHLRLNELGNVGCIIRCGDEVRVMIFSEIYVFIFSPLLQ